MNCVVRKISGHSKEELYLHEQPTKLLIDAAISQLSGLVDWKNIKCQFILSLIVSVIFQAKMLNICWVQVFLM